MISEFNFSNAVWVRYENSDKKASIKATINGKETFIPLDPDNRHYAEILKQVAEGTLTIQEDD